MIKVNIDASDLADLFDATGAAKQALADAARDLTVATHAHIVEEANRRLHTRRGMFIDSLSYFQINEDTWVVSLEAKARWIDDGLPEHNMLDDLLKSPKAKTAKDGSRYIVIPFKHNGGATQLTPAQTNLLATIKSQLKKQGIPYGKLEKDEKGTPKLGKLHSFDLTREPLRTGSGPGQGRGPVGRPIQGPTGIPVLQGVSIYQRKVKDKQGKDTVKREIMTFRVASSKHKEQGGRWDHPGLAPMKLMDEGLDWAKRHWEMNIAPKVLGSLVANLS
jgi:hypothetical protein